MTAATLNATDARRISALIDEACERLDLLELIHSEDSRTRKKGEDQHEGIDTTLEEHRALQRRYAQRVQERNALISSGSSRKKGEFMEIQRTLEALRVDLRRTSAAVRRGMRADDPATMRRIAQLFEQRAQLGAVFQQALFELRDLSFVSLRDRVLYYQKTQEQLLTAQQKEAEAKAKREKLEEEFENTKFETEARLEQRELMLRELNVRLKAVSKEFLVNMEYNEKASAASLQSNIRLSTDETERLRSRLSSTTWRAEIEVKVHGMTKKYLETATEIERQAALKMDERHNKEHLEQLTHEESIKEKLTKTQIELDALEVRWNHEEEDRKAAKEAIKLEKKLAQDRAMLNYFNNAARTIQQAYRTYKSKKKSKAKPAKKKGKGKSKKGASKKKNK